MFRWIFDEGFWRNCDLETLRLFFEVFVAEDGLWSLPEGIWTLLLIILFGRLTTVGRIGCMRAMCCFCWRFLFVTFGTVVSPTLRLSGSSWTLTFSFNNGILLLPNKLWETVFTETEGPIWVIIPGWMGLEWVVTYLDVPTLQDFVWVAGVALTTGLLKFKQFKNPGGAWTVTNCRPPTFCPVLFIPSSFGWSETGSSKIGFLCVIFETDMLVTGWEVTGGTMRGLTNGATEAVSFFLGFEFLLVSNGCRFGNVCPLQDSASFLFLSLASWTETAASTVTSETFLFRSALGFVVTACKESFAEDSVFLLDLHKSQVKINMGVLLA